MDWLSEAWTSFFNWVFGTPNYRNPLKPRTPDDVILSRYPDARYEEGEGGARYILIPSLTDAYDYHLKYGLTYDKTVDVWENALIHLKRGGEL